MKKNTPKEIGIIGAGLVGSLLAILLAKRGHKVTVHEFRQDMRKKRISAGKSINLALSDRGWKALEQAGIADEIRKIALPMKGRMIHNPDKSIAFQPYGVANQAIYSVSRGGLNQALMQFAEKSGATLLFENGCADIDLDKNEVILENGIRQCYDLVFGADGAFSKVRLAMMKTDRFDFNQFYLKHGYKELVIPPAPNGGWLIDNNALHIWPRSSFMLIALPNIDGSFTCTLFAPFEGDNSFERIKNEKDLLEFFNKHFPDAVPLMPTLASDYFTNPTSSLVTVKCQPWTFEGKTALIGDAAHAIVPFYGQGMNCGFEDCSVLERCIDENPDNWPEIFDRYSILRKLNGDAIADLAIRNFLEMRDKVADPQFLLRKQVEKELHNLIPDEFIPLYSIVTFSHLPYSLALEQGALQDRFFLQAESENLLHENLNPEELESLAEKWRSFSKKQILF